MESAGVHKTSDKEEVVRDKAGVKMKSEQASHQSSRGKEDEEDEEEDEGKLETSGSGQTLGLWWTLPFMESTQVSIPGSYTISSARQAASDLTMAFEATCRT